MSNNKDFVSLSTGGLNSRNHDDRKNVEIEAVHPKTEIPNPAGLAKASPNFKELKPKKDLTEDDLKKSIAKNTKKVDDPKTE